jgi:hypothetical protein
MTPDEHAALREIVSDARAYAGEMERSAYELRGLGEECEQVAEGNRKVAKTLRRLADVVEAHVIEGPAPAPGADPDEAGARD